jgi:hypothetical protein
VRYRKKPVVIEAIQIPFFEKGSPQWLWSAPDIIFKCEGGRIIEAVVNTLEGTMTATSGDWIIQGVKGELYPCKPDIFSASYDPVEPM